MINPNIVTQISWETFQHNINQNKKEKHITHKIFNTDRDLGGFIPNSSIRVSEKHISTFQFNRNQNNNIHHI